MITLTTPTQINSVLGGSAPVAYDKLVLSPLSHNPIDQTITGTIRMTSTAQPDMQAIIGSLNLWVQASQGVLEIQVQQLDFYRRIKLSAGQIASVMAMISAAQNAVEAGLVGLGVIVGTQSTGA
jgi:hypothetical protein